MYKIIFYVPVSHLERVKQALFTSGAGKIGQYSHCAWQILGEGQFMPLAGSHPYLGKENHLETAAEYKVELVCDANHIHAAIAALKQAHPYEEPAYQVIKIEAL
jgi:structural toxin protein (hemagglutinin/hemolysin) RtxA